MKFFIFDDVFALVFLLTQVIKRVTKMSACVAFIN